MAVLSQDTETNFSVGKDFVDKQDCLFKKGGGCINHGVMGTKYVETTKVWAEKKIGAF